MRTAVLGLFFVDDVEQLLSAVADISRITHHDPRSIAGGVAIAKAAQLLAAGHLATPETFCVEVADAVASYDATVAALIRELPRLVKMDTGAAVRDIAWSGMARPEFEEPIITPFVVPAVLAALWCVLRRPDSWAGAVASATDSVAT